tara:strand:+ start:1014 stop:1202 length:189 start_codon:yes stop_codon:yes gene_type:complete
VDGKRWRGQTILTAITSNEAETATIAIAEAETKTKLFMIELLVEGKRKCHMSMLAVIGYLVK